MFAKYQAPIYSPFLHFIFTFSNWHKYSTTFMHFSFLFWLFTIVDGYIQVGWTYFMERVSFVSLAFRSTTIYYSTYNPSRLCNSMYLSYLTWFVISVFSSLFFLVLPCTIRDEGATLCKKWLQQNFNRHFFSLNLFYNESYFYLNGELVLDMRSMYSGAIRKGEDYRCAAILPALILFMCDTWSQESQSMQLFSILVIGKM